jgi:hypothetical protein
MHINTNKNWGHCISIAITPQKSSNNSNKNAKRFGVVCIYILMGRQHSLMSIHCDEGRARKRGRSFVQAFVNGIKSTYATVQINKQADGWPVNQDLSQSTIDFGALSRANNRQWCMLSIDVGGELLQLVSREDWREMEREDDTNKVMSLMCKTLNEGGTKVKKWKYWEN